MELSDLSTLVSAGSQFLPPPYNLIGMGAGAVMSGIGKSQASQNTPPEADPRQLDFLSELDRMRKSFDTGSAYTTELKELRNTQSATMNGISRAAGGQSGLAIAGFNRAAQSTNKAYGDIAAQGEQRQDMFTQMYGSTLDKLAERKLDIQTLKYNQRMADASESDKANLQYLMQFLAAGGDKDWANAMKTMKGFHQGSALTSAVSGTIPSLSNSPVDPNMALSF